MLKPQDIVERRVKCNICGYELTAIEYLISGCYCVFHETDEVKLDQLRRMSKWGYLRLLLADLDVMRAKLEMKSKDMTQVDYMACVGAVKPELQDMNAGDMRNLVTYMKAHESYEPL
jgi:hypothetical protein